MALERCVAQGVKKEQRLLAGSLLFLVFARMRCSDASRIIEEPVLDKAADGSGYLETKATYAKGARSAKRRRLGLPVVALRRGISGVAWADSWLDVRREHGCDAAVDGGLFLALEAWTRAAQKPSNDSVSA